MLLGEIIAAIEACASLSFQEKWDNSGLQVGKPEMNVDSALLCVDVTEDIVDEAIRKDCHLIISHHPLLFSGVKHLCDRNVQERCLWKAVKHDIAIYSAHTSLDNWSEGVSYRMAQKLSLRQTKVLSALEKYPHEGCGMIGYLPQPVPPLQLLEHIKQVFKAPSLRYTDLLGDKPIGKIALCGGAGGFLLEEAVNQGADLFLSADFKYHDFFRAEKRIVIADIGHYESEQYAKELLYEIISKKIPTFALHYAESDRTPVHYL